MTGGEIIAFAGVLSTLGATIFTQWWQRRGERERSAERREQQQVERWLDYRRDVYVRFMRGADDCWRAVRGRLNQLGNLAVPEGAEEVERAEIDLGETSATAGLVACADALAEMRLVAPSDVIHPATLFLETVRELEYFTALSSLHAPVPGVDPSEGFQQQTEMMHESATAVLGAMRADMGASPADLDGLGNIDPTIYGC